MDLDKIRVTQRYRSASDPGAQVECLQQMTRICTACSSLLSYEYPQYLEISLLSATHLKLGNVETPLDTYVKFRCEGLVKRSRTAMDTSKPTWGTGMDVCCFRYQRGGKRQKKREICVDFYDENDVGDGKYWIRVIDSLRFDL